MPWDLLARSLRSLSVCLWPSDPARLALSFLAACPRSRAAAAFSLHLTSRLLPHPCRLPPSPSLLHSDTPPSRPHDDRTHQIKARVHEQKWKQSATKSVSRLPSASPANVRRRAWTPMSLPLARVARLATFSRLYWPGISCAGAVPLAPGHLSLEEGAGGIGLLSSRRAPSGRWLPSQAA